MPKIPRHQHDPLEVLEGCIFCEILRLRMLTANSVEALQVAATAMQKVYSHLTMLDSQISEDRPLKKKYSPEELERRKEHGRKLGKARAEAMRKK